MSAARKKSRTMILMALLTAQTDRNELDQKIMVLTRSLADAHDIPVSYPPVE
jgi:hypothetical protein